MKEFFLDNLTLIIWLIIAIYFIIFSCIYKYKNPKKSFTSAIYQAICSIVTPIAFSIFWCFDRIGGTIWRRVVLLFLSVLIRFLLRVRIYGEENIPKSGPTLLVSNHISLLDIVVIKSIASQRVHFLIRENIYNGLPFARYFFDAIGMIPVPAVCHPKAMKKCFEEIRHRLHDGETICFFPEGEISGSGNLMRFISGVKSLLPPGGDQVNVIPIRLGMISGRMFGYDKETASFYKFKFRLPRTWPIDYSVSIGEPVSHDLDTFQLRQVVSKLGAEAERKVQPGDLPVHTAFIRRAKSYFHLFHRTFIDGVTGQSMSDFKMLITMIILSKEIRAIDKDSSGYVGMLLPNAPIAAAVTLAIMCADRTPAVINFSSGSQVALDSARRAQVKTIITSRKFLQKLKWAETSEMRCLEDIVPNITVGKKIKAFLMAAFLPWRNLVRNLSPYTCHDMFHDAVLLFSSGSTGKPKAVRLTQRNLSCDISSFIRVIDLKENDRICGNLPLFHAYGFTAELAFPCISGKQSVFIANPLDATAIVKSIREYKLSVLTATPTFMQMYMKKATPEDFKSLRLVVTGAEKLRTELADKYREMTGKDIIEGYGCTELSPIVTINLNNSIYSLGTKADHPGSIGCPLPGIHIRIVDPDTMRELGPNQEGRIQVFSGTIMKGYLNDPEKTKAVILDDGFYDTGDIGKMDKDGYVYVTGRASRFSKIGGEMVPHETIEDAITKIRHSENREVAVSGRADSRKGEKLVVLYTADDFNIDEVIAGLREQGLPNIWIPKAEDFFKVDSLPILGSGKLNLVELKNIIKNLPSKSATAE